MRPCAVAALAVIASAALAFLILRDPPPDFDSVVRIPPNASETEAKGSSPSQLALARIDAWVLTHDLFADLKAGKITRDRLTDELVRLERKIRDNEDMLAVFGAKAEGYVPMGVEEDVAYLLQSAISNLTAEVKGK